MPRQDVPYGGAICRLKERIAEIWDKLGEKLHSINGVEGDGAGDVKIVSGDAAVVINSDKIGHKIEVGLDKSKLPSGAVSSVNGETGAVRLDAADIPSDGNSDVQADIDANKAAINKCSDSIASEQTARENADAALQGNIDGVQAAVAANKAAINKCSDSIASEQTARENADAALQGNIDGVQANIDAEASARASAVSAEATARQDADSALQTAVDGKAAKTEALGTGTALGLTLSTGAGTLRLARQTVSGALSGSQVIIPIASPTASGLMSAAQASKLATPVVNGTDANSIGLRDANGRMQAADPESGATDKTLVTANWVSQTGDASPNNLIHKNGNENATGTKTLDGKLILSENAQYAGSLRLQNSTIDRSDYGSLRREIQIAFFGNNNVIIASLILVRMPNGKNAFIVRFYDKNGNYHDTTIASYQDTP